MKGKEELEAEADADADADAAAALKRSISSAGAMELTAAESRDRRFTSLSP